MARQEYEYPNCWIRGHMDEKDYQDDPVSLATIRCPYRKGQIRPFFFGAKLEKDYDCTHPAVQNKDEVEGARVRYGAIMAGGGVDEFKTFCKPVDMHLTSLGEKSQLAIEGRWVDAAEEKQTPSTQAPKSSRGIFGRLLRSKND